MDRNEGGSTYGRCWIDDRCLRTQGACRQRRRHKTLTRHRLKNTEARRADTDSPKELSELAADVMSTIGLSGPRDRVAGMPGVSDAVIAPAAC